MPNPVIETFEHLHNMGYLHVHKHERPFPLNGSDWARLVNERLEREQNACLCHRCLNFLTKLHSKESPLGKERRGVRRAMHYWFLQGQPTYGRTWKDDQPIDTDSVQHLIGTQDFDLAETEARWVKENTHMSNNWLVEGIKSTYSVDELDALKSPVILPRREEKHKAAERARAEEDGEYWKADSCDFFESRPRDLRKQFPHTEQKEKQ